MATRSEQECLFAHYVELAIGRKLEVNASDLPGRPDIVFRSEQIAVMFHGCFWHSHDCSAGSRRPQSNWANWYETLEKTVMRDVQNLQRLRDLGWRTMTVWECWFAADPLGQVGRVRDAIQKSTHRDLDCRQDEAPATGLFVP